MLLVYVNLLLQLEMGQLLTVPPYLVKRRQQHFHHLEQYDVDLILGCNGFIWVGKHVWWMIVTRLARWEIRS
jgi:exosome complex RNA-binding protein Rrp4